MNVTIDANSGFCFGVVYAIQMAEDELDANGSLFCLGDIVRQYGSGKIGKEGLENYRSSRIPKTPKHESAHTCSRRAS